MRRPVEILGLYLHLARASSQRRRPQVRDRLLVLAAAGAARLELHRVADYCRYQILEHNPQHLIRHWPSVAAAMDDARFQSLMQQLQRRYPLEKADRMRATLGIELEGERATYFSDEEYAAALLGMTLERLHQWHEKHHGKNEDP